MVEIEREDIIRIFTFFFLFLLLFFLASSAIIFLEGKSLGEAMLESFRRILTLEITGRGGLIGSAIFFSILLILAATANFSVEAIGKFIQKEIESVVYKVKIKAKEHYIVCGAGRVGSSVARELAERGEEFVIIEKDANVAREMRKKKYKVIEGDCLVEETLDFAAIQQARGLFACLGEDTDNFVLVLLAKEKNPKIKVAVRANSEKALRKLEKLDVECVVMPELIGGKEMVRSLVE